MRRRQLPTMVRMMSRIEEADVLDDVADSVQPLADALVADGGRRRMLHGHALGHALHPLLSDAPIGSWLSTAVLDLTGGARARPAARRLLGFGILAALPTAITGWAEWAGTDARSRRVGLVHAGANSVALGLHAASWLLRRSGRHGAGVALSMLANGALAVAGQLGGHLTVARKVGSRHEHFAHG